jgi:hypothetical protein
MYGYEKKDSLTKAAHEWAKRLKQGTWCHGLSCLIDWYWNKYELYDIIVYEASYTHYVR